MGVKVRKKIMFGNYVLRFGGRYQFDFVNVKVNYLVRSMFAMYIFVVIIVAYKILVALQMITFYIKGLFACLKFGLFGLFFQPEQCFSLTTIQPEQCFSASFSQNSDQRTGPNLSCFD